MFVDPFILACATKNSKLAASGVNSLQRLIVCQALPKTKLKPALEAFAACAELGLDVELKILQALPSLLENYAGDLKGDLLGNALQVCSSLQGAKAPTVSGVAAATLQQLVTSVFEKVENEDRNGADIPTSEEVPGRDGPIALRPAAFDAYRVFRDLALTAEGRKTKFIHFTSLSSESSLELMWSCVDANVRLFCTHVELKAIIGSNVIPLVTRALSEKMNFAMTLRSVRILDLILTRCIHEFPTECEVPLGLTTHVLDPEAAPLWKRALAMEMLRNYTATGDNTIDAYLSYDMTDAGTPVVQELFSAFVRLSAEKPTLIGLGQQSTAPIGLALRVADSEDATTTAAEGVAGVFTSALGVSDANLVGVGSEWSLPRTPCLEQLDKSEPPSIPETYVYALVLECLNHISASLAKTVLPHTVNQEKAQSRHRSGSPSPSSHPHSASKLTTFHSAQKGTIPLSPPAEPDQSSVPLRVQAAAGLLENCWPAVLATSSTFLNAALDDQYYRSLIKAYQRFAQVAGLLGLNTARDALMTTLGKVAVPPHILSSSVPETPRPHTTEASSPLSNKKALLSVDGIMSPIDRRSTSDTNRPMLTTRNLLCLRALLNLAIALGPAMGEAFGVVLDTLRQADAVLRITNPQSLIRQGIATAARPMDSQEILQAFRSEVAAVEAAASRLLESTAEFPDDAFLSVLATFCRLLHVAKPFSAPKPRSEQSSAPTTPRSTSPSQIETLNSHDGTSMRDEARLSDYKFIIPKLGKLAELNITRFVSNDPAVSGWNTLVEELASLASNGSIHRDARRAAADVLCKLASGIISVTAEDDKEGRRSVQQRTMAVFLRLGGSVRAGEGEMTSVDIDIQGHVVETVREILESCGESLVASWEHILATITNVFRRRRGASTTQNNDEKPIDWNHVSTHLVSIGLGNVAFGALQLLCSDFLAALPTAVFPSLVELLYRFIAQEEDLNISLTTVTMTWHVADFLLDAVPAGELDETANQFGAADDDEDDIRARAHESRSAQWLHLLSRLRSIVVGSQKEVRKAAFQTICSIFRNQGHRLSPATWDPLLRNIIFKTARADVALYHDEPQGGRAETIRKVGTDEAMSKMIVVGTADMIAGHLDLVEQVAQLPSLWEAFLSRMEAYLDLENSTITTAVFDALHKMLMKVRPRSRLLDGPMYRTLHFWLKHGPIATLQDEDTADQHALTAFVEAGTELYRLTSESMTLSQRRTLVEKLYLAIRHANGPRYNADVNKLSPLQEKTLKLLKRIKTDTPSTQVTVAAKLVVLPFEAGTKGLSTNGPTFVAVAKDSIEWLRTLVIRCCGDADLWDADGVSEALQSLCQAIEQKHTFPLEGKNAAMWQTATSAVISVAGPVLEHCDQFPDHDGSKAVICTRLVSIVGAIVTADGLASVRDVAKINNDQNTEIESFKTLRRVLFPRLEDPQVPDQVRAAYVRSMFDASIIHPPESGEIPEAGAPPMENLGRIRRGRVRRVAPSQRERMSFECFSELVRLVTGSDDAPRSPQLALAALPQLALAALPQLTLRLAVPIRAYIADQPLRGRRPQPLSELEELLYCFRTIEALERDSRTIEGDPDPVDISRRQHLRLLYPLLIKAIGTAGDGWSGSDEVLAPLRAVLEAITPLDP